MCTEDNSLSQDICFIILGTELQNPDSTSRKNMGGKPIAGSPSGSDLKSCLARITSFTEQPELGDQGKWRYIYEDPILLISSMWDTVTSNKCSVQITPPGWLRLCRLTLHFCKFCLPSPHCVLIPKKHLIHQASF